MDAAGFFEDHKGVGHFFFDQSDTAPGLTPWQRDVQDTNRTVSSSVVHLGYANPADRRHAAPRFLHP